MPLSIRALSLLALAGVLFALLFTKGSAEPPELKGAAPELRVPQAFQDAADGKFRPGGTGDPIADDVLQVMAESPIASRLDPDSLLEDVDFSPASDRGPAGDAAAATRKALAAEQMLRAARLLENLGTNELGRVTLIQQMRSEARRLLSE